MNHIPVLSSELISGLVIRPRGLYLDATLGFGGHTKLILAAAPEVKVVAIDQDKQALDSSQTLLASYNSNIQFCHSNFADYDPQNLKFDGILADLGINSVQLDTPERGFSFRHQGKLDMRMNQQQTITAAKIINHWEEVKLANIFYTYGEERLSRRIARKIIESRPLETTTELAEVVANCVPYKYRYGRIHPATRVFQALRIEVNQELSRLETFLKNAPHWLKIGGRIGIISFHSLEDRLVKHSLRNASILKVLTKKPIQPQDNEVAINPRARSAKLRLAEKLS
ncbi:MAG: 16S rRNA (cytosine(1402)-N(4))-methyltransferase RsmH [Trichodesmium sp. St16_bin4-tuft]|uniref:Ribosomal RNA small subunit methyltransferase H n=1 Tax=Trichodesmium erythraeum (strain IMS101) TaxID=203124 RepID=RSMH_TRIEI|nr:RecName: Full=Ribosomal RNA small subunit methyltransferase H; AltName: Full=16S rRNA m(4)C1402 methyltransferase; AltName: Full=rRNA (cytosine-N(4)-)-methyltransferase RsmH [Trichodesmium erythraeum IMS101]MBS9769081.1 16S rRNA (cytosine(1402)-N(4))-methyltransferase RsmH [Trichodesmium erythraeum GBRTRLIN201]MCH2048332.1 16S rRNA (cytosine(1402)-N(4))-methyltransferase RsmH [Trichodesmium sp. ALOHA_ZT_67]MDE5069427.1 16S rRNA (cytosine(1402)-N(4))-methyltransferase RsmH [Trichodesmium sp. S